MPGPEELRKVQADLKRGKGRGHVSAVEMRTVARPCGKQPDAQQDKGAGIMRKLTSDSQHNVCLMPSGSDVAMPTSSSGADDHDNATIDPYALETLDPFITDDYALVLFDEQPADVHADHETLSSACGDDASTYMESPSLSGLAYMTRCRML